MGHIKISNGIASEISERLDSIDKLPNGINKYVDFNIANEDNIKEYMQASSRGQGEDYMEYLEEDNSVDQTTVDAAKNIDVSNTITEDELRQKINQKINSIYDVSRVKKTVNKLEEDINEAIRENNLQSDIASQTISSMKQVKSIMEKIVRYAESAVFFLGVAGSMLLSELGKYTAGVGMMIALFTPFIMGAAIYDGTPMVGLKILGLIAAYIVGGGVAYHAFDDVAKSLDQLYQKRRA